MEDIDRNTLDMENPVCRIDALNKVVSDKEGHLYLMTYVKSKFIFRIKPWEPKHPTGSQKILKLQEICKTEQASRVEGLLVDTVTANTIMTVYEVLKKDFPRRLDTFIALSIYRMATFSNKVTK